MLPWIAEGALRDTAARPFVQHKEAQQTAGKNKLKKREGIGAKSTHNNKSDIMNKLINRVFPGKKRLANCGLRNKLVSYHRAPMIIRQIVMLPMSHLKCSKRKEGKNCMEATHESMNRKLTT